MTEYCKKKKAIRLFTKLWILLILVQVMEAQKFNSTECPNIKSSFSDIRKRRHLAFPEGSNIVLTVSVAKAFHTHVPSGWNIVLEIDVLYHLPDAKFTSVHWRRKLHHRQKRDFWERLRNTLEFHNLNGRACVLRSICEAKTHLLPPGVSLVHDILRAVFTAPLHEKDFTDEVKEMYSEMLDPNFCDKVHECPFSILHFVLSFNKQKQKY